MAIPHFDRALLPPAREFYERELGKLSRPSRGWARGNCPFHESKSRVSFAINLSSGGFHCFGCDAKGGDVVAFLMRRNNVPFQQAAQMAGAWRDQIPNSEHIELSRLRTERDRKAAAEAARTEAERQERISTRDLLHMLEKFYQNQSSRLAELQRGAAEQFSGETESCWELLSLELDCIRNVEAQYWQLAGLEVSHER
jgi:DNA primase